MSIIFKKLKSLETADSCDDSMENIFHKERKIYVLKKMALSASTLWITISAVSSFLLIIFISFLFLKETIDSGVRNAVVALPLHAKHSNIQQLPGGQQKSSNDLLPSSNIITSVSNTAEPALGNELRTDAGVINNDAIQAAIKTVKDTENKDISINKSEIKPLTGMDNNGGKKLKIMPALKSIAPMKKRISVITNIHKTIYSKKKKTIKNKNHFLIKKKKKKLSIEELAMELEEAVQENNNQKTDKILGELIHIIKLKRNRNNYYFKLMAFKAMRNSRYDLAEKILKKILAENKNDFEAGMNMAVIEIKEHKYEKAEKRLKKLKERYPLRTEIDALLNQL